MLTKPTVSNHVRMNAICPTTPKNRMCVHSFHLKWFIPIQNSLRLTKYEITALLERLQQTMGDSKKCQTERFFPQVFFSTHLHFIILKKAKEKKKISWSVLPGPTLLLSQCLSVHGRGDFEWCWMFYDSLLLCQSFGKLLWDSDRRTLPNTAECDSVMWE